MRTGEHDRGPYRGPGPGPDFGYGSDFGPEQRADAGSDAAREWNGRRRRSSPWSRDRYAGPSLAGPPWRRDPDDWHPGGFRRSGRGPWLLGVVALLAQIPGLAIAARQPGDAFALAAALLGVAAALSLLARRRHPGPVVAVAGALAASSIAFGSGPPFAAVPLAFAVLSGVVRGARPWVWGTLAGVAVIVPVGAYLVTSSPLSIIRPLIVTLILCLLVGVGEAVRTQRERYRETSREIAARRQSAAEAERVRIARELHDVLAHSLSQISVQAGVGLHLFDSQPNKARESLEAIKATSGQALEEVRGVLGFLRDEGDDPSRSPAPDLGRLPALVQSFQRGGLAVGLTDRLGPGIPKATQLAIYRIVQESLTNAARHSAASTVTVALSVDDRGVGGDASSAELVVTIVDDGRGPDPAASPGGGLTGMRERAELLGGRFSAGTGASGGFQVEVRLPRVRSERFPGGTTP